MKRLVVLLITLLSVLVAGCPSGDNGTAPATLYFTRKYSGKTSTGTSVFKSTSAVTDSELSAVQEGISRAFDVATFNGYSKGLDASYYEVELQAPNPKCTTKGFTVAYTVRGTDPYDNSQYDKNPAQGAVELCVAGWLKGATSFIGQCLPTTGGGCALQKAVMQVVNDPAILSVAVYNEAEHQVLASNDSNKFLQTLYHTGGNGHPILTQPPSFKGSANVSPLDYVTPLSE